jgi:methionyl-tRNA synthetase
MKKQNSFYITTTLPYVNAPLHLGHALEFVRADAIARYKALTGFDVFFNTGTDEHGMKVYEKAREENLSPQEFVDRGFEVFKKQTKIFGISENIHFVRTTGKHHIKSAQEFWNRVSSNGYIYKKNYQAKYCVGCESEKTDSDLDEKGECPIHPGKRLELINEENYFFKFSAFQKKLLEFYEKHPNFVIPDFRFNEMKVFVKNGLQDFSISRLKSKMPWGIEVPDDPDHVMYVWFDALVNYISTLGWPEDKENFEKYWINGTPTQYCGKDNTRFQSVMWQAMLMAAGVPNSYQIVVNGFITGEGGVRMSKTLGNIVDPRDIVNEYGTDALRYFLLREISSFEDSPFTIERFKKAYNSGLANGLGNVISRILTMAENHQVSSQFTESNFPTDLNLNNFDIKKYMDEVWEKIQQIDKKIQEKEPYKLFKIDTELAKSIVADLCSDLLIVARKLLPVMPETARKILDLLKENKKPEQPLFLRKE